MQQKLLFYKGTNVDDSPEALELGQMRFALNVRIQSSENGNKEAAEKVKGNTLVSYTLPSGSNRVIGSFEYKKSKKIYYFVFNSLLEHSILEYDSVAITVTKVLQNSLLNFSLDRLITGINIIELDEDNHLLYWTDFRNEPRKINIRKGKLHSSGDYVNGYPTPFEARWITRVKQPPQKAPVAVWSNDTNQLINYLFKKNFTFKSLYVFDDFEESVYSPISKYVMPFTTLGSPTTGEDFESQDNTLTVTVLTGSSIVKKIRIVAKETNALDYAIIAELDKELLGIADNTTYDFTFYNNGNYVPVEAKKSNNLFDRVPLLSQSQEVIAGNKIVDGFIVEGYDNVAIDMQLPLTYEVVDTNTNSFFPKVSYLKPGGVYKKGIVYYDEYGNRPSVTNVVDGKSSAIIAPDVNIYGTTLFIPFVTDPSYGSSPDMSIVPRVSPEIYNRPPSWAKYYQLLRSKNEAMDRYIQFAAENVIYLDETKAGIVAPAVAEYVSIELGNITGRYLYENPLSDLVYDWVKGDRIRFICNPQWALLTPTAGALAPVGGNDHTYTVSAPGSINTADPFFSFNDNEIISYDSGTGIAFIKMAAGVPNNLRPGVLFEIYQPAENVIDNNEIMYEMGECYPITTDAHGNTVHGGGDYDQMIFPFSVATYVAPTFTAAVLAGHGFNVNDKVKAVASTYSVFGIVTATTATSVTIDTTGYTLIGTFNGGLSGEIIRAAKFMVTGGDTFRRYQDMPFELGINVRRFYSFVDAENASNMFPSKMWDVGRPNKIDPDAKQITRPATIYYSESFIQETFINGLSSVYGDNFESYNNDFGGFWKLYSEGYNLFGYQERKVIRIGVNQSTFFDPVTGGSVVAQSTDVLGKIPFEYEGEYGISQNPESFAVFGNAKFHIDVNRGVVLRLSNDGLTAISKVFKMHKVFTDICQFILDSTSRVNIYGVYDARFSEYVLSISSFVRKGTEVAGRTFSFNIEEKQWGSTYSYLPENMCSNGLDIVSFKNGSLYRHNSNSVYNNFYGTQYTSKIWVYCNANPSEVKAFEAVSLETSVAWDTTVETPVTTENPSGQTTSMTTDNFELKQGFMYSEILKDDNTPNTVPFPAPPLLPNARFEGNILMGPYALIKLENTDTAYNKIFACNVEFISAPRSNQ